MSRMGERAIMVENGEACPRCLTVYPAPTDGVASVTCGRCGFVNCLTEQAQRQSLEGYYADKAATFREAMEDAERMGRTVQYLDREGVELEWRGRLRRKE